MSDVATAVSPTDVPPEPAPVEEVTNEPEKTPEGEKPLEGLDAFLAESTETDLDLDEPTPVEEPTVEPEGQVTVKEPAPEPEPTPPVEPAALVEPATPVAAPTPDPVPAPQLTPEPAQVAPPPPAEPQPVQQPAPAPAVPQQTPAEAQAAYAEYRKKTEELLSSQHYALDEGMTEALDEDAAKVIPQLMSKVYMDAVSGAISHIVNQLPGMVESVLTRRDTQATQETQFFEAWPQLNVKEHRETIVALGAAYRQVLPQASPEQFIRDVGAQAIVALRLAPQAAAPTDPAPPPAVPAFKPAAASPPTSSPGKPQNAFEALNAEFDAEELDLD